MTDSEALRQQLAAVPHWQLVETTADQSVQSASLHWPRLHEARELRQRAAAAQDASVGS